MDETALMKLATSVARHNLALVLDNPEQFVEDAAQEAVLAMWLVQHDAKTRQYLRNAGRRPWVSIFGKTGHIHRGGGRQYAPLPVQTARE